MSAFTVEHQTITRVISYMQNDRNHAHLLRELPSLLAKDALFGKHFPSAREAQIDYLAKCMLALNYAAVNYRYDKAVSVPAIRYTFEPTSIMQAAKHLSCWLYQCAEGEYDQTPLYQFMQRYRDALCYEIVADLPEWNAAQWDAK